MAAVLQSLPGELQVFGLGFPVILAVAIIRLADVAGRTGNHQVGDAALQRCALGGIALRKAAGYFQFGIGRAICHDPPKPQIQLIDCEVIQLIDSAQAMRLPTAPRIRLSSRSNACR